MFKRIIKYFDKLDDRVRARLSHRSIAYAAVGGFFMIVYWRAIWDIVDNSMRKGGVLGFIFNDWISLVWSTIALLLTGLFVSSFIGERIIMSGLKQEKKDTDKTKDEVFKEEDEIKSIQNKMIKMAGDIEEIKDMIHAQRNEDNKKTNVPVSK